MSINGEVKSARLQVRFSQRQDKYLTALVESGRYVTKTEAVRALVDKAMESAPA